MEHLQWPVFWEIFVSVLHCYTIGSQYAASVPDDSVLDDSALMAGVPFMAPKVSIRGSVSDNTHERFTAVRTHAEPAEGASSGTVSHIVMVKHKS